MAGVIGGDARAAAANALATTAPAVEVFAITQSDTLDFAGGATSLYFNTAGNVTLLARDSGTAVTLAVTASQILPVNVRRVYVTGTTATGIFGMR